MASETFRKSKLEKFISMQSEILDKYKDIHEKELNEWEHVKLEFGHNPNLIAAYGQAVRYWAATVSTQEAMLIALSKEFDL